MASVEPEQTEQAPPPDAGYAPVSRDALAAAVAEIRTELAELKAEFRTELARLETALTLRLFIAVATLGTFLGLLIKL